MMYSYPMLTYDLRSLLKRPGWVLLLGLVAYCFYTGLLAGVLTPRIPMSMSLPLLGPNRTIISVGEWGRALLLSLELFLAVPLSALTAFMIAPLLADEMEHRDALWSTPRAALIPASKVASATSLAWLCFVVGATAALANPSIRTQLSPAGWQWLPLLLALTWLRIALWTTGCAAAFYLGRSKWAAVGVVPIVQTLWFGLAAIGGTGTPALVHRELLAWGFLTPYAPLGVGAPQLAAQAALVVGAVLLLFGCAMWARGRASASLRRLERSTAIPGFAGAAMVVALLAVYVSFTQRSIGSPTHDAIACPAQEILWSERGALVQMPGAYSALRLPSSCETPAWFTSPRVGGFLRRFDDLPELLSDEPGGQSVPDSLVVASLIPDPIPDELSRCVERYVEKIAPMVALASAWIPHPLDIVLIYPAEMLGFRSFARVVGTELWVNDVTLTASDAHLSADTAWALAERSSRSDETTAYFALVLMNAVDRELAESVVDALDSIRTSEQRSRWPYLPPDLRRIARAEGVAEAVLEEWELGERTGHAVRFRKLMQGEAQ